MNDWVLEDWRATDDPTGRHRRAMRQGMAIAHWAEVRPDRQAIVFDGDTTTFEELWLVVHDAAPCPVHVTRAMIEWWGPIIVEYYSVTEGRPLPAGKRGLIRIRTVDAQAPFRHFGDDAKTATSCRGEHYTLGDDEWGETVLAVVEPAADVEPSAALAAALIEHCRTRLAGSSARAEWSSWRRCPPGRPARCRRRRCATATAAAGEGLR